MIFSTRTGFCSSSRSPGYIYKDATGYRYVYQYKDHLGNNRLSFMRNAGTVAIVKETNYYPFGLTPPIAPVFPPGRCMSETWAKLNNGNQHNK